MKKNVDNYGGGGSNADLSKWFKNIINLDKVQITATDGANKPKEDTSYDKIN